MNKVHELLEQGKHEEAVVYTRSLGSLKPMLTAFMASCDTLTGELTTLQLGHIQELEYQIRKDRMTGRSK